MNLPNKISAIFHIRPGEGQLVGLLLIHSFFLGSARIFIRTAAFALFLGEFEATQTLPYVYIGISLVGTLASFIYLKLSERLSLSKLLMVNLNFLLLVFIGFRLGLGLTDSRWLVFALPIGYTLLFTFANLEFWVLSGRLLNVRQGKRLFGLISAGQPLAITVGGLLVPSLVALIGTPNLLIMAVVSIAGALGLLVYTTRLFADHLSGTVKQSGGKEQISLADLLKDHYILLIISLFVLGTLVFYFTDNIFFAQADVQYPDEDQLASFIGLFFGMVGLMSLFSQAFLSGRIVSRFGLRIGLLISPVILITGTAAIIATGIIFKTILIFFWAVSLTKFFNFGLREALDRPALNILYQPLPANQQVRVKTVIEGIIYPIAVGLTGLVLALLTTVFAFESLQLAYVLFLMLVAWILVSVLLGRKYLAALMQALIKRRFTGTSIEIDNWSSLTVLQQALQNSNSGVVIYALNRLEEVQPEAVVEYLPDLLTHPTPEVRQESLQRIEQLRLGDAFEAVRQAVETETVPPVLAAALRTLATLCDTGALEQIFPYLENPDPQIRRGAIVGLLQNAGVEVTVMAEAKLLQMAMSQKPTDRMIAAQAIGDIAARNLRQLLEQLLQDEDLQVRRAALTAAGQAKYPELWSLVVAGVSVPYIRGAAAAALIAGGEAAATEVQAAFAKPDQDRQMLIRLARVCGRISGNQMVAFLKENLDFPDNQVRTHILAALSHCDYQATDSERLKIQQQIKTEVAQAASTLATLVDVDSNPDASSHTPTLGETDHSTPETNTNHAVSLLVTVLNSELDQIRTRIFFLLSFIYDTQTILQARATLEDTRASPKQQAYAIEVLDLQLPREIKTTLLPLLQKELNPRQCLKELSTTFPQQSFNRSERLQQIITDPAQQASSWAKACALYATALLKPNNDGLIQGIISTINLYTDDALVAEMAIWSLATLDGSLASDHMSRLNDAIKSQIAKVANQLKLARSKNETLLSTVDKVMILKKVDIFVQIADEVLADLATLLAEVSFKAGETIIEKGDHGDCMYLIVGGKVRIHDGPQTINHLHPGDAFGEMALLEPKPRTVSVTADEDTHLLRLDQEPFYELIEDHIELVRGIIHLLAYRLRNSVRDLTELNKTLVTKEASK